MRPIKLMADYQCYPLWGLGPDDFGDISPDELPLSEDLKTSLNEWAERFDAILNMDDPATSDFNTVEEEELFINDGYNLALRLRNELGSKYEIIYQPLDKTIN